jgi:hypothetical protein
VNSKQLSGSYGLTGSLQATSFTGSLYGTASWAQNASTASYVSNLNQLVSISGSLTVSESITATVVNSPRLQNGSQYIVQDTATTITAIVNGSQTWGFYPGGQFYPAGVIGGSSYGSNQLNVTNLGPVQLKGTLYGAQIVTSPDQETTYSYAWNFKTDGDLELPTGKSITGSLFGTASQAQNAISSSYAATASFALNGGGGGVGFPFSGSAVITGSLLVSGSGITGSLLGTASYATFALTASTAPGYTVQFTQSSAAATWSFDHNMNTRNPIVQVYDSTYKQIIPNDIVGTSVNTAEIRFDYATTGYVVMSNGGGLYVTGSTSMLTQTSAATTWSFTHNLNSKYVNFEVYDSNDYVIIPAGIRVIDTNNSELHFAGATAGKAVANFSGINGAPNATTASYALTATSASYALTATSASFASTASYLNPIQSSYVILSQVSASLNFVDDTAAAAGGVPLGGLYRNGNFILIRIS